MIFEREAVIHDEGGIHARVAAMIVQRAQELCERYDCHLYIRSERSERCEMHSLMKLVALKVAQGDSVFVSSEGDNGRQAVIEMVRFLESDFIMNEASEIHGVDKLLHENALMQERLQMILESVQDGICVVDRSGEVTYVNPSYLRIVHKTPEMVVGQNVFETAADGNRCAVLRSGIARIGSIRHKKDGTTIVANVNPIFVDVLALASKAADSSANVLIRGESGTGKEVIAEGIHYASGRRRGPFIRVNCGAIPGALLESELFGHEKGAFTGAVRRKLGKFELANHGTIFLDEIGELDKNLQVKLLRVLQQKEFDRVGGEETIHVDVRIIAATNRDLEAMVREGTFRDDLYYRLNVIPIILPPLRDRPDDIPLLVEHFIEKISKENKKDVRGITPDAMQMFMHYRWPGNVRELENVIERVITLMDTDLITAAMLPSYIKGDIAGREVQSLADDTVLPWEEYEKQIIANALRQGTSFNGAAKLLRISHKTVAAKARKYGLV